MASTLETETIHTNQNNQLSKKYQKKTDKQHVLENPDTYTGSMEETEYDTYIYDEEQQRVVFKHLHIIPGLYKLFDEGIVNCRDHYVRMEQSTRPEDYKVSTISISIQQEDGTITMMNDGNGIDVEKHPEHDVWIPEMIFAHLRTSTNYNKEEKKIVGGKNGFGFKLVLIWSSWGRIETIDHIRGLKYTQEFENNLDIIHPPVIRKCSKTKPYTKVEFRPDYKRLGMLNGLSQDMIQLFKRRVFDIGALTDKKVKVKYNDELIPVRTFQNYVDLYIGAKTEAKRYYEEANERWEYAVALTPRGEFTHVSFVNGIYTCKGGKHVDYILGQITRKLVAYIKLKKKIDVKASTIKEQLMLFVRCDIENPTFDSQTKDYMTTPVAKFGSSCEVSDKCIEMIAKMGVMDSACALTEIKETKQAKKTDGTKTRMIRGIPKLIDANYAGTAKSHECMLILCEGDSAKAGIVSGLSKEDRNVIGVYPMRGKLFNVRGETPKRVRENKEICEIKQILGLEIGIKYTQETARNRLRYGRVLFMTDQDLDGSHIKGLGINLFDSEWDTLLQIPRFIGFMNTPILKARKGSRELVFYNDGEYETWKKKQLEQYGENGLSGWHTKYYKGLGTSTSKEFKEYFQHKKIVCFTSNGETSRNAIDMVFNKKRALDRKTWLEQYERDLYLDTSQEEVSYEDFIGREMIHFSKYDCERSIPNMMDGLKTSQRKILYSAFKRRLTNEIKVAQFSGYVSEHSSYHHGEQSLNGAIVNMAQDFVGSNNINVLEPKGQFGTRLQGGSDSASERYIFTHLNPITRMIYREEDDKVLNYLNDDGTMVEPDYYVPIIPMILVNGCKGIGTGFSTEVLSYQPKQIIRYIKDKIGSFTSSQTQTNTDEFIPYFEGFKGRVEKIEPQKYLIKGCYEIKNNNQVHITELPIGVWTDDYKQYLETIMDGTAVKTKSQAQSTSTPIPDGTNKIIKSKSTRGRKKKSETMDEHDNENDASSVATKSTTKTMTTDTKTGRGRGGTALMNLVNGMIKEYADMSTDKNVDILITFKGDVVNILQNQQLEYGCNALEKVLKLYTTKTSTNMHLFDNKEKLRKFETPTEIIDEYMKVRKDVYTERKRVLLIKLRRELMILRNKVRFIEEHLNDELDLRKKSKQEVYNLLREKGYDLISGTSLTDNMEDVNDMKINEDGEKGYKYLVKMPMDMVTSENVSSLMNEMKQKQKEVDELEQMTEEQLWLRELNELENEYDEYVVKRRKEQDDGLVKHKIKPISNTASKTKIKIITSSKTQPQPEPQHPESQHEIAKSKLKIKTVSKKVMA
jgi:DNA topoisomerase II